MELIALLVSFILIAIAAKQIGLVFSRLQLPYITGYIFAGALAGPFLLELLPPNTADDLRFVDDIALAIIAFTAGNELYLRELQSRLRSIGIISITLTVITVGLGTLAILLLADFITFMEDMPQAERLAVALLGGTVLAALAPAVAIPVIQEVRARGPFTKTVLGVTISMDVVIIVTFAMMVAVADVLLRGAGFDVFFVIILAIDLILSVVLGLVSGKILEFLLSRHLSRQVKIGSILLIGFLIYELTSQVRDFTYGGGFPIEIVLEPLLISVIAGLYVTNFTAHRVEFSDLLHVIGPYVYVAFFTLTGIALKLDTLIATLPTAVALFTVRLGGLFGGSFLGGTLAGDSL
ncbi:MAG: cation:proton antiporter, partial [Anaerolineales bacterium]